MDWTTPLRAQQADFIQRLKSGHLLHCETQGQHSELTVISGQRLKQLRDFCWQMAEKYKRNSQVRDVFINNLKGKLGEEVVKARLGNLVTEVDYEKRIGGDGKVDFRLSCVPSIGIQVKACHGSIDTIQSSISKEEAEKNAALICVLIQEEVNEAQVEYNLIMAGFLPTSMIGISNVKASFKIDELLYSGGLHSYLESLSNYINLGNNGFEKGDYLGAIANYNQALQLNPNLHFNRGLIRYHKSNDSEGAILHFTEAIRINPNYVDAYVWRGAARYKIEDKQGAIEDWTEVTKIIPNYADAYQVRGRARHEIGDEQGAILDYTETLRMNPNNAEIYFERGVARSAVEDHQGAIEDYTQVIRINPNSVQAYINRSYHLCVIEDKNGAKKDLQKAVVILKQQTEPADYQKAKKIEHTIFALYFLKDPAAYVKQLMNSIWQDS